jgi:2-polyprenyl-6-methoxyphenol hydroxylase-like FAD-dependent oxidoreductase
MDPHYDVIVVGGRCAGSATAMLLARGGLRVLVVEATRPGTDTLSTHALMRAGVLLLDRWGLLGARHRPARCCTSATSPDHTRLTRRTCAVFRRMVAWRWRSPTATGPSADRFRYPPGRIR